MGGVLTAKIHAAWHPSNRTFNGSYNRVSRQKGSADRTTRAHKECSEAHKECSEAGKFVKQERSSRRVNKLKPMDVYSRAAKTANKYAEIMMKS